MLMICIERNQQGFSTGRLAALDITEALLNFSTVNEFNDRLDDDQGDTS